MTGICIQFIMLKFSITLMKNYKFILFMHCKIYIKILFYFSKMATNLWNIMNSIKVRIKLTLEIDTDYDCMKHNKIFN